MAPASSSRFTFHAVVSKLSANPNCGHLVFLDGPGHHGHLWLEVSRPQFFEKKGHPNSRRLKASTSWAVINFQLWMDRVSSVDLRAKVESTRLGHIQEGS